MPQNIRLRRFLIHAAIFVVVVGGLAILNYTRNPGDIWVTWVVLGWGLGLALHGLIAYRRSQRDELEAEGRRPGRGRA